MINFRKRTFSFIVLCFYSLILLFSFQNCGVKGFDIDPALSRNPDSESQSFPTDSYGITDLTKAPSGKMIEYKLPNQLVNITYSAIDSIDGTIYAFSSVLNKFISFTPDSDSFNVIEIPDQEVIYIKAVSRSFVLGSPREQNLNMVLVQFMDVKFKIGYGVFNIPNRSWSRVQVPDDDPLQNFMISTNLYARMTSNRSINLNLVFLTKYVSTPNSYNYTTTEYYQAFDNNGKPLSDLILYSKDAKAIIDSNVTTVSSSFVVSKQLKTVLDIRSGNVKSLPNTFSNYDWKVFKQDMSGVIYDENYALNEFDFNTGVSRKILTTQDFSSLINIDEPFSIFENSLLNNPNQSKYLVRSNNQAPLAISGATFYYASTPKNLILFSSDTQASDFRIQVRIFDKQTQKEVTTCSQTAPLDTHVTNTLRNSSNFIPYFQNNMRILKNMYAYAINVTMDKTCSNLYLGVTYTSTDGNAQLSQLFKYSISSGKTELAFESSAPIIKGSYISRFTPLGFKDGNLVYRFGNSYYSSDKQTEIAKDASSSDQLTLSSLNSNNYKVISDNRVLDLLIASSGSVVINNPRLKYEMPPDSVALALPSQQYMILSKEGNLDTQNSSSFGVYFYNENNSVSDKKNIVIPVVDAKITQIIKSYNYITSLSYYSAFALSGKLNGEVKDYLLLINAKDRTYKIMSSPGYLLDAMVLDDGSVISANYLCSFDNSQCVENPFSGSTSGRLSFANDLFVLTLSTSNLTTIVRYVYDANKKIMNKMDSQQMDISIYSKYVFSKNWILSYKTSTANWTAKNVATGKTYDFISTTYSFSQFDDNRFYGFAKNGTESTPWILDLTQNTVDLYQAKDSTGKLISGSSIDNFTYYTSKLYSNFFIFKMTNQTGITIYIWDLVQRNVVKELKLDREVELVNLVDSELLFKSKYYEPESNKFIKFTWLNLKTMLSGEREFPQYQKLSCSKTYVIFDDSICVGLTDRKVQLSYWNNQTHNLDILADNLSSGNYITGFVALNKNLLLLNFGHNMGVMSPASFTNFFSYNIAEISNTSQTFVYRK